MGKVTVVGSYIVAAVMDTDRIPIEGETLIGRNYHVTHGGKGSNMAVCAARLGAESRFMGKIGKDNFGEQFVDLLKDEGVASDSVLYSDNLPTAIGFIIFSTTGSNIIVIDIAANGEFLPDDINDNEDVIRNSQVIVSPLEIPLQTALAAAKVAKSSGVRSILNPAPAVDLRKEDLSDVFALTPNETEGRVCLGLAPDDPICDDDLARALLRLGAENIMLTVGEKGVIWVSKDGLKRIPALSVNVLDTVGAGDAFNAGLAVGLSEGKPVAEAIAFAVTAASLSTEHRETIDSYQHRQKVEARLAEVVSKIE